MVMQYLISRNEEYLRHIENFDNQIGELVELIQILEYNILGLKQQLTDFTDKESDDKRKEIWFAEQQEI